MPLEERQDLYDHKKEIWGTRRNLVDQIDCFFNLMSHILTDVNGFQESGIEHNICTPEMFNKIIEIFNVPLIADLLAKDNVIYRDMFKSFINEHPSTLLKIVHENMVSCLDQIEVLIGPINEATSFTAIESPDIISGSLSEVTTENVTELSHNYTNNERLELLYCRLRNYCCLIRTNSRRLDEFLKLDISNTIKRISSLRKTIIYGGWELYSTRLRKNFKDNEEDILKFDKDIEVKNTKLTKDEYEKKYAIVEDLNYCRTTFSGVLEFNENERNNVESEAEVFQSEAFKFLQLLWKRNISNQNDANPKKNIQAIVQSVITMTNLFDLKSLEKISTQFEAKEIDRFDVMASLVKFNWIVEEIQKLLSSDSPYITKLYLKSGYNNLFELYHWLRWFTPILYEIDDKRIQLSKHLQLLWSNLGDLLAISIEAKYLKESREQYSLITEKHKSDSEFISSLSYHICHEIFKQEDIIAFYLRYSKYFLECLIDIMKLLIDEEQHFRNPARRENRINRFGERHGIRNFFAENQHMEHDEESITTLTVLGFTRTRAIEALNRTHGNVEMSANYLLALPPEVVQNDRIQEEEAKKASEDQEDSKMEVEDSKDEVMEESQNTVFIKTADDLVLAVKDWLECLYKWLLKGFNCHLTDIDIENITIFILKFISKEKDVDFLMKSLNEALISTHKHLDDDFKDKNDSKHLELRKWVFKKALTLAKIISNLGKYYMNHIDFIVEFLDIMNKLFDHFKDNKICLISGEPENVSLFCNNVNSYRSQTITLIQMKH